MSERNDGGPAFPRQAQQLSNGEMIWEQDGMSLRQWYAGQALRALLSRGVQSNEALSAPEGRAITTWLSADAFFYADAMIAHEEEDK